MGILVACDNYIPLGDEGLRLGRIDEYHSVPMFFGFCLSQASHFHTSDSKQEVAWRCSSKKTS